MKIKIHWNQLFSLVWALIVMGLVKHYFGFEWAVLVGIAGIIIEVEEINQKTRKNNNG